MRHHRNQHIQQDDNARDVISNEEAPADPFGEIVRLQDLSVPGVRNTEQGPNQGGV